MIIKIRCTTEAKKKFLASCKMTGWTQSTLLRGMIREEIDHNYEKGHSHNYCSGVRGLAKSPHVVACHISAETKNALIDKLGDKPMTVWLDEAIQRLE